MIKELLVTSALILTACTNSDDAHYQLLNAGYHDITIDGYRWFGCSKDDAYHTGFRATGPTGRRVSGIVCEGWMKGATIRFD